jgi:hypothetical protein
VPAGRSSTSPSSSVPPPSLPQPWYQDAPLSGTEQLLLRHAASCTMSELLAYLGGSVSSPHARRQGVYSETRRSPSFWQQLGHVLEKSEVGNS